MGGVCSAEDDREDVRYMRPRGDPRMPHYPPGREPRRHEYETAQRDSQYSQYSQTDAGFDRRDSGRRPIHTGHNSYRAEDFNRRSDLQAFGKENQYRSRSTPFDINQELPSSIVANRGETPDGLTPKYPPQSRSVDPPRRKSLSDRVQEYKKRKKTEEIETGLKEYRPIISPTNKSERKKSLQDRVTEFKKKRKDSKVRFDENEMGALQESREERSEGRREERSEGKRDSKRRSKSRDKKRKSTNKRKNPEEKNDKRKRQKSEDRQRQVRQPLDREPSGREPPKEERRRRSKKSDRSFTAERSEQDQERVDKFQQKLSERRRERERSSSRAANRQRSSRSSGRRNDVHE